MAKLARDDKSSTLGETSPSVCILLKNMFDPNVETEPGWEKEVEEDVKSECTKYGEVLHIAVDKVSDKVGF
jgi:RNA-binding protein 39